MSSIVIRVASAAIATAIVTAACGGAQPAAAPRTAQVTRGSVTQTVSVSGSVNAAGQVKLNFKSTGKLLEVYVSTGQQVTAGQRLAKLDTSDLEVALAQAQAGVAQAQASYDKATAGASAEDIAIGRGAVDNAQRSLDETQRTTANDITNAQQTLTRLTTSYTAARSNFDTQSSNVASDAGATQAAVSPFKSQADGAIRDVQASPYQIADAVNARSSLNTASAALASALSYAGDPLNSALNDYVAARDNVLGSAYAYDAAMAASLDTSPASRSFAAATATYGVAANRLSAALDAVSAQLGAAATPLTTSQNLLSTAAVRAYTDFDAVRANVTKLLLAIGTEQQREGAVKAKLTQAANALGPMSDALGSGISNAQQAITSAQEKANSSIIGAQNSVQSAQLSLQKTSAGPKSYDIAGAYASTLSAQANLQQAQNNLANATMTAPVSGLIVSIGSQVGEFVASGGTTPFILLANTSSVALHGTVGEGDVAKLNLGQVATLTVDAVGTARMTGRVTAIDPVATIQQGVPVYGVDVTIDVPNPAVRPGMSGTANVILASRSNVLTVPNLAVRTQGTRRYVQVMKDGQTVDADATFGISNDTVTEVLTGLEEGDVVVLPQPRAATSGQPGFGPGGGGGGPVVR